MNILINFLIVGLIILLRLDLGIIDLFKVSIVTIIFYNFLYFKVKNDKTSAQNIFSVSFIILYSLLIITSKQCINLGYQGDPFLPGDGLGYYLFGIELTERDVADASLTINYLGYPIVLSYVFKLLGTNFLYGLLVNLFLLFINIVLSSRITYILTGQKKAYNITFLTLLFLPVFLSTGFQLLKDSFILLSVTLSCYASLCVHHKQKILSSIIYLFISLMIMALFRFSYILAPVIIFSLINLIKVNRLPIYLIVLFIFAFSFRIGTDYLPDSFDFNRSVNYALSNDAVTSTLDESAANTSIMTRLISGYEQRGFISKILYLPITCFIQYMTPFNFYDFSGSFNYLPKLISTNLNLIWLILIGPLFIYSFIILTKRIKFFYRKYNSLLILAGFGVCLYAIPAFIYGGAIPRYAVISFPLMLPLFSIICYETFYKKSLLNSFKKFYYLYAGSSFIGLLTFIFLKLF